MGGVISSFCNWAYNGITFILAILLLGLCISLYDGRSKSLPRHTDADAEDEKAADAATSKEVFITRVYRGGIITGHRSHGAAKTEREAGEEGVTLDGVEAGALAKTTWTLDGLMSTVKSKTTKQTAAAKASAKNKYWGHLRQDTFVLYTDETRAEVRARINLSMADVKIIGDRGEDLREGELFSKQTFILVTPKKAAGAVQSAGRFCEVANPNANATTPAGRAQPTMIDGGDKPWYFTVKINSDKEDWYQALLQASRWNDPEELAKDALLFNPELMQHLIQKLDESSHTVPTRWLIGMYGRLYLGVHKTQDLTAHLLKKFNTKLAKLANTTSGGNGEIEILSISLGSDVPMITEPLLKSMSADGKMEMTANLKYTGEIVVHVRTHSIRYITESGRKWGGALTLDAIVTLKAIEGTLLFMVKPQPSNRIWYGFIKPPTIDWNVNIQWRALGFNWVKNVYPVFESQLKKVIDEAIVLPNMDDMPFFDTSNYRYRGGIYADTALRPDVAENTASETQKQESTAVVSATDTSTPGVPHTMMNEKLANDKSERPAAPKRKTSGDSVKSSKSVPLPGKDAEHVRKRSWFTSKNAEARPPSPEIGHDRPSLPAEPSRSYRDRNGDGSVKVEDLGTLSSDTSSSTAADRLRSIHRAATINHPGVNGTNDPLPVRHVNAVSHIDNIATSRTAIAGDPAMRTQEDGSDSDASGKRRRPSSQSNNTRSRESTTSDGSSSSRRLSSFNTSQESGDSESTTDTAASSVPASDLDARLDAAAINGAATATPATQMLSAFKARDRQAMQASLNTASVQASKTAKELATKWGNSFNTLRRNNFGMRDGQSDIASSSGLSIYGGSLAQDQNRAATASSDTLSQGSNSRTPSLLSVSSSAAAQFQPSGPVPTVAVVASPVIATDTTITSSSASKTIHRVPPPSTVAVHPAISLNGRQGQKSGAAYAPAPMMSIPGMDESRRFATSSSAVLAKVNDSNRDLDSGDPQPVRAAPAVPARLPKLAHEAVLGATASDEAQIIASTGLRMPHIEAEAADVLLAAKSTPPLPARHSGA